MADDHLVACYVDTSALSKRYVEEEGSDQFDAFCSLPAMQRLICPLGVTEFTSVMQRRRRMGLLTGRQVTAVRERFVSDVAAGGWRMIAFETAAFAKASELMMSLGVPLTTLDALHLATALQFEASEFATADKPLAVAALKTALRVHTF